MNISPNIPTTASATGAGENPPVRIAIHFGVPKYPAVAEMGFDSPMAIVLLNVAMRAVLANGDRPAFSGDLHDGIMIFHATRREATTEKLRRFFQLEETGLRAFTTTAWWCENEQAWRIIQQGDDTSSFESRMTEERHAQRAAVTARIIALAKRMRESLPPLPPE